MFAKLKEAHLNAKLTAALRLRGGGVAANHHHQIQTQTQTQQGDALPESPLSASSSSSSSSPFHSPPEEENANGNGNEPKKELVKEFREALERVGTLRRNDSDDDLLRFLQARSFDLAKAQVMYEAMVKWRHEISADTIIEVFDFPERKAVKDIYPHFYHKTDKMGRPVYIERLGQLRLDDLLKITTMDRMILHHVQEWEILIEKKFPACSKKSGIMISQSITILDLKGVNLKHMNKQVRQYIQKIVKIDQDYYPEHLGKMLIVNAPTAFKAVWSVIKPWLDKKTQKKIEFHGSNYRAKLLELIDAENLPDSLGGSCCCLHLGGCQNSNAGPWNDSESSDNSSSSAY